MESLVLSHGEGYAVFRTILHFIVISLFGDVDHVVDVKVLSYLQAAAEPPQIRVPVAQSWLSVGFAA